MGFEAAGDAVEAAPALDSVSRWDSLGRALARPLSARAAALCLTALVAVSILVRAVLAAQVHGPFIYMDELGYERMARAFARTGHLALFGKAGLAYSPLYPIVLSPVYALTSSAHTAYGWAKDVNAVLMSLSVFPAYAVARSVLSRPRALGAAALSLLAPLMFYTQLEMSESLAYPLFLVAVWALLRAVRSPSARNDALLLAAIALACAARLQQIALVPAAITAIVLVALVRPAAGETRLRSIGRALSAHRLLVGLVGLALLAGVVRTLANGGSLPLAGRYANVGHARPDLMHVLAIAVQHLAELDFALGVVPFAGALLASWALARAGFPRRGLVFGAVAVAVTVWLLLEVAFDAAAFDTGVARPHAAPTGDLPRIHERYLIYLVPLFLVALVAALRAVRPRVGTRAQLAIALVAALLPAAIPFGTVINYTIVADSFGLQIFGTNLHGRIAPIPDARLVAVGVAAVFAAAYLYALLRPRPSFAIVVTVIAFLMLSTLVRVRIIGAAHTTDAAVASHAPWVDRAVRGGEAVLVGGPRTPRVALLDTAFQNLTVIRVYTTCRPVFGSDFGETRLAAGPDGTLTGVTGPIHAAYAVVPIGLHVRGRVLARRPQERLELVQPAGGILTVPLGGRAAAGCVH